MWSPSSRSLWCPAEQPNPALFLPLAGNASRGWLCHSFVPVSTTVVAGPCGHWGLPLLLARPRGSVAPSQAHFALCARGKVDLITASLVKPSTNLPEMKHLRECVPSCLHGFAFTELNPIRRITLIKLIIPGGGGAGAGRGWLDPLQEAWGADKRGSGVTAALWGRGTLTFPWGPPSALSPCPSRGVPSQTAGRA